MLTVTVLCIGKLKEHYWSDACHEYRKRLGAFCKLNLVELEECRCSDHPAQSDIRRVVEKEGIEILSKIPLHSAVIALCIEGKPWSSEELAAYLQQQPIMGCSHITFIIGGSFGLSQAVKERAQIRLSFSKMTFPHQLFRVLLLEQLYRGFQIGNGGRYHK